MAAFNRGTIISTAIHEAYPGHYVQFLWVPQAPSTVRKILGASSNAEGWAHYCEQMMLDEGYGQPGTGARDARDAKMIRLGQLQDALLRDARFVVGIQMHTGQMTFDQAVNFFVDRRVSNACGRLGRDQARDNRCDLSLLHFGQAADSEVARRSGEKGGRAVFSAAVPRRFSQAGIPADKDRPPRTSGGHVAYTLAYSCILNYAERDDHFHSKTTG